MTPQFDDISDLAFDLYAAWEDRKARGENVSLEEVCAAYPGLLPEVQAIARQLATIADLFPVGSENSQASGHRAGSLTGVDDRRPSDWIEIDRGASSIVYRGHDPTFGTAVAYKVLQTQGRVFSSTDLVRLMKRFEQEARILARLKHEGIVRIFKTFGLGGRPVLEMEYLPGGSLVTHLDTVRAQAASGIARFMERVARAVGFAHAHGIVHRDLKPSNILLNEENLPCVSDFGVAKLLGVGATPEDPESVPSSDALHDTVPETNCLTAHGRQPGTWAYMAPEQFDPAFGPITPRTDVWALGVILYELLMGRQPFRGASFVQWKASICSGYLEWPGRGRWRARGRLERIARRCLSRDPAGRYQSATELAEALAAVTRPSRWKMPLMMSAVLGFAPLAVFLPFRNETPPVPLVPPGTPNEVPAPVVKAPAWINPRTADGIVEQLERGETVVVCGTDTPLNYRTVLGGPDVRRDAANQVTINGGSAGAVEFVPRLPPRGRFGVRATLRHVAANTTTSMVGLFVGGTGRWVAEGSGYCGLAVGFTDRGPVAGHRRLFSLQFQAPLDGSPNPGTNRVWGDILKSDSAERVIEFDVSDGQIDSRIDGNKLPPITEATLQSLTKSTPQAGKLLPEPNIRGAIGVYVSGGFVVIERIEVFPLPPQG